MDFSELLKEIPSYLCSRQKYSILPQILNSFNEKFSYAIAPFNKLIISNYRMKTESKPTASCTTRHQAHNESIKLFKYRLKNVIAPIKTNHTKQ